MNKRIHKLLLMMLVVFALAATLLPMYAYATTVSVLDGKVSISDTKNNISVSNGVVTVKGNGGLFGGTTNTITIINETDAKSKLTFSYSASANGGFSEDSTSGTKSADLEAGASITMSIKGTSGLSNQAGVLTLSDFSLVPIADTSNVTYEYDSALGSVTAGGTAIASGAIQAVSGETGVALVAAPVNDARFLGWINAADGTVLSTATSYTLIPAQTMTVKAVFAKDGGIPWFGVGATTQKSQSCGTAHMQKIYYHEVGVTHLFDDLNAAAAVAGGKAVVLMNDATLPAGDYTIPASVTLLIPFDTTNTIYTVGAQYTGTYTQPSEYRTLTMAEGANLVINGAMSVSAKQKYAEGGSTQGGVPVGDTGFVRMNQGSTITINDGGALYAYGYIIGSGTVTAKNGSTVYEGFQLMDFRGGAQSSGMKNNVFPMSQYYVQNIEVPLTLEAGATEHAYTWMMMSIKIDQYYYNSDIAFIGSDKAMFKISSGSVTKRYDPDTDRLIIEVDGDLDVSSVSLTFDSSGSISSEKYVLALNGNISVIVNSGTININQDIAFLPGAHMAIGKDASVVIGQGKRLYVYDKDEWGEYVHLANTAEATVRPLIYVPTRDPQINEDTSGAHLTDASILIEGTLDASQGTIYTTASGAQITGSNGGMIKTKPGTETITYQVKDQKTTNDPNDTEYAEIPITPVKLINSNATIVETGNGAADSVTTYTYTNGFWICDTHNTEKYVTETGKSATCTESGTSDKITCGVCGTVIQDHTEIPALGHTDTNEVGTEGYLVCDTEGCNTKLAKLAAFNVSADSTTELSIKLLVHDDLVNSLDELAVVTFGGSDPLTRSTDNKYDTDVYFLTTEATPDGQTRYVFTVPVASGYMNKDMIVAFEDAILLSGDATVKSASVSVDRYIAAVTQQSAEEKLLALVSKMSDYGKFARIFFFEDLPDIDKFVGDHPVVEDVTIKDTYTVPTDEGIGIALSESPQQAFLDAAISLRVYFTLSEGSIIDDYTFHVKSVNGAKNVSAHWLADTNEYYIDILNIPAAYLDETYTITVKSNSGKYVVETSVLAYLADLLEKSNDDDQKNLARAMYWYNDAANEFIFE